MSLMHEIVTAIKKQFIKTDRIAILDFIMEDIKHRPTFEKVLEADVLYAITKNIDENTSIKGNKRGNYDFFLPTIGMEIEFKATKQGSKGQLMEIRHGKPRKGRAKYYLLIAPEITKVIEFLNELEKDDDVIIREKLLGKNNTYTIAIIQPNNPKR